MRAELRNWREVFLNDTSYYTGQIFGDAEHHFPDGAKFTTGFKVFSIDRGDHYIIKTAGNSGYVLYKDKEFIA